MDDKTMAGFLAELASPAPAPGGGAAAALQAALGAALVSMVCNLTIGRPRYAEHEATMLSARSEADKARAEALALAAADARAFAAVSDAYKLPKGTDEERAARSRAIQTALVTAAEVPLHTAAVAAAVVGLCARIIDGANVNVLSDVGVAAASARAALDSAAINVRVNTAVMTDADARERATAALADHLTSVATADSIVRAVGERIGS
ncbi:MULTISPECIES: cyclodeaminase/cyclohydrolase family protein [Protofrankia]|uniref:Formiminotransferase-cyclodeaminase n=1 Tax=Protofrankia coriariae TaxID=1562887 RepID=A0ABR5F0A2_9ACTN|nr:cyclodeaminase/cyclohydrolase family protein [Protofrankia coriariae]KLL10129.1 formiminotransferase-cyclodeaminase [Protofrankia coriariae]ONH35243.1 formiminotransferase-cyclodeaminase [Protofrankia sp. BMG5.30]